VAAGAEAREQAADGAADRDGEREGEADPGTVAGVAAQGELAAAVAVGATEVVTVGEATTIRGEALGEEEEGNGGGKTT
jgi:hypothetical protein